MNQVTQVVILTIVFSYMVYVSGYQECSNGMRDVDVDALCDEDPDGFEPHPNCSLFYRCVHGVPNVMSCSVTLYYNPRKKECDSPANVPECVCGTRPPDNPTSPQTPPPTTTTTPTTTTPTTTTPTPTTPTPTTPTTTAPTTTTTQTTTAKPICDRGGVYYIPKEGTCKEYIMCIQGTPFPLSCSEGELFNPELSKCVLDYDCPYTRSTTAVSEPDPDTTSETFYGNLLFGKFLQL